jgi:hypothetical protein
VRMVVRVIVAVQVFVGDCAHGFTSVADPKRAQNSTYLRAAMNSDGCTAEPALLPQLFLT